MLEADKADLDAILSLTTQKLLERRLQTKVRLFRRQTRGDGGPFDHPVGTSKRRGG